MEFIPHPYQAEAIKRIEEHEKYGLFLDMGLGKTVITLTAIHDLIYDSFEARKVLIIAPKSVAESTWQDEAAKWDHLSDLRFSTVLGSAKKRIEALHQEADCYVINRENVTWLCEYYKHRMPFDMLVVDESSSFKNASSKRFRSIKKCLPLFERVILLTGTPTPNTIADLWAQMYMLDRGESLGKNLTDFRRYYLVPDKYDRDTGRVYSYLPRNKQVEKELYKRIGPKVFSLKARDYIKLPPRIDNVVKVTLPKAAKDLYHRLEEDLVLEFINQRQMVTATSAAALSNKLLQIANGRLYTSAGEVIKVHDAKLEALSEIAETNEGKNILVFYNYKFDLEALRARFPKAVLLKGEKEMREWNAGKISMLLAHPASSAYGLNLQSGGHIIVWYGLTWSLELYQQANARLYRQGQDKPVIINHLVATGTVDTRVMSALRGKATGQNALLEAVKGVIAKYAG